MRSRRKIIQLARELRKNSMERVK